MVADHRELGFAFTFLPDVYGGDAPVSIRRDLQQMQTLRCMVLTPVVYRWSRYTDFDKTGKVSPKFRKHQL